MVTTEESNALGKDAKDTTHKLGLAPWGLLTLNEKLGKNVLQDVNHPGKLVHTEDDGTSELAKVFSSESAKREGKIKFKFGEAHVPPCPPTPTIPEQHTSSLGLTLPYSSTWPEPGSGHLPPAPP